MISKIKIIEKEANSKLTKEDIEEIATMAMAETGEISDE